MAPMAGLVKGISYPGHVERAWGAHLGAPLTIAPVASLYSSGKAPRVVFEEILDHTPWISWFRTPSSVTVAAVSKLQAICNTVSH